MNRSSSPHVSNSFQIFKELVYSKESRFTGLYRGLSPNLVGNSVSWALYFVWYDNIKTRLRAYHGHSSELVSYDFFLASGAAGIRTILIYHVIKNQGNIKMY